MGSYDINILACIHCEMTEFDWSPSRNSDSAGYICSKCLDVQCHGRHRVIFIILFRKLHKVLPQLCATYIYDVIYPTNHNQLKRLNRHNYAQHIRTLQVFLGGAPCSNNYIHDLHQQLQQQSTCELFWNGNTYRTSSWVSILISTSFSAIFLLNRTCKGASSNGMINTIQWQHKVNKTSLP